MHNIQNLPHIIHAKCCYIRVFMARLKYNNYTVNIAVSFFFLQHFNGLSRIVPFGCFQYESRSFVGIQFIKFNVHVIFYLRLFHRLYWYIITLTAYKLLLYQHVSIILVSTSYDTAQPINSLVPAEGGVTLITNHPWEKSLVKIAS